MNISQIYHQLQECYTRQARHFVHTRKKHRPEFSYVLDNVRACYERVIEGGDTFHIVEFGCGGGRLYGEIAKVLGVTGYRYTGVDFAQGMIDECIMTYTAEHIQRVCSDMLTYIATLPDESVDSIIGIAAVQHLMTIQQRQLFRQHVYRVLRWKGSFIVTNWSYSEWFLRKYRRIQLNAIKAYIFSYGAIMWNDLLIPRKDPDYANNDKIWERYYHIFTLYELQQLSTLAGFVIKQLDFVSQQGELTQDRWTSRNSLLIGKKDIGAK